ncbi:hypothetical protein [Sphaerotilus sp.]
MNRPLQRWITHPALALGSTVLWGCVELVALWKSRNQRARQHDPSC